jgi:hypothetical protein
MKFLYFLIVCRPLCRQVYPGTFAASTCSTDVLDPGWLSYFVMDPQCCLCDLFFPFFLSIKDIVVFGMLLLVRVL